MNLLRLFPSYRRLEKKNAELSASRLESFYLAQHIENELRRDRYHLEMQIKSLADVLLNEFGGPTQDEGACEMAVRLLREFKSGSAPSTLMGKPG